MTIPREPTAVPVWTVMCGGVRKRDDNAGECNDQIA